MTNFALKGATLIDGNGGEPVNDAVLVITDGRIEAVGTADTVTIPQDADMLKIMTTGGVMSEKDSPTAVQYSLEEIKAFTEEARNAEVKTTTHGHGAQGIKNAILGGIDCIEHGTMIDEECVEMMVKHGTNLVPTFAIVDAIVTKGRELGVEEGSVQKAELVMKNHMENFLMAYRAGVTCGLGTDYLSDPMSPHGMSADELDIYVNKAGLTPMEAIVCATKNNAVILDRDEDIGTLEAGKLADFLVVDGDPLADITILKDKEKISDIYKEGVKVPRLAPELRQKEANHD